MLAYLDVETTGLKTPSARIVEVACVVMGAGGVETASFSTLVNPGAEALLAADPGAWAVNGLSPEALVDAPSEEQAAHKLEEFLGRFWGSELHAFNSEFDAWFLAKEPWNVAPRQWGDCVMLASQKIMGEAGVLTKSSGGGFRLPSLAKAAVFFGVIQAGAHRALTDARTAAFIHKEILRRESADRADEEVNLMLEEGL
jgi:DNA polymerase III epsilon subunit-like protein